MTETDKHLLVVVDGTERSLLTIRYLIQLSPCRNMQVTVMNVFSDVPDAFWDLEKEPHSVKFAAQVRSWCRQQESYISSYLEKCCQMLIKSGFPEEKVTSKIYPLTKGVVRDIITEAQKGAYHAVVLRRRGVALLGDTIMGSVAANLLEKLTKIPLMIAGQEPGNQRILIALDGSPSAVRAVEFVGNTVAGSSVEIELIHAIRRQDWIEGGDYTFKEIEKDFKTTVPFMFNCAIDRLVACGVSSENISTKLVTGVGSRAGAIVETAKQGNFSTIVVGRRGISKIQEFFLGRVGYKVIQTAKRHSVWVVN